MTNIGLSQDVLSIIQGFVEEAITSIIEERNAAWQNVLLNVTMAEYCDDCEKYREQDLCCVKVVVGAVMLTLTLTKLLSEQPQTTNTV